MASRSHARSRSGPAGAASEPGSATRSPTTVEASSVAGSTRISAAPASTWAFTTASTSRTRPDTGARTAVSIFMLSRTTIVWPASTSSPTPARTATTTAGAGARTRPSSSRVTRCVTPSTSTRCDVAACEATTEKRSSPMVEPALQRAEPVDLDVDGAAVEPHPVPARGHLRHRQLVGLAPVAELDHPPHVVRGAGASAAGRGEECRPLHGLLGVGDVDRHLDERDDRVALGVAAARRPGAVQPGGVGGAGDDLRAVEQREQEGLRRRPAADHHGGLAQRARAGGRAPPAGRGPRR